MKFKFSLLFSTLAFSSAVFATDLSQSDLSQFNWQAVDLSQKSLMMSAINKLLVLLNT